jgi:putative ABC transport system ATP-binding protein
MSAELEIKDLTVQYERNGYVVKPIDGLNARAEDGELVLLLGPSGCGKTTLMSCMSGLLTPTSGTVRVGKTDVTKLSSEELNEFRRHTVGIVFQAFNLIPSLTSLENVMVPLRLAGVSRSSSKKKAKELLDRVGLGERMDHKPDEMSGGQQQRVAIARALVHDPPLIVADEPTAHLDFVQVEEVLRLLREIAAPGRLVVAATHDDRFEPLADRVIDLTPHKQAEEDDRESVKLNAGEILFRQGDDPDFVYVVKKGEIEVFRELAGGAEEHRASFGPGEYFGELGPMLSLPRSATARAVEDTELVGYGLQAFRRWQRSSRQKKATAKKRPARKPARRKA